MDVLTSSKSRDLLFPDTKADVLSLKKVSQDLPASAYFWFFFWLHSCQANRKLLQPALGEINVYPLDSRDMTSSKLKWIFAPLVPDEVWPSTKNFSLTGRNWVLATTNDLETCGRMYDSIFTSFSFLTEIKVSKGSCHSVSELALD